MATGAMLAAATVCLLVPWPLSGVAVTGACLVVLGLVRPAVLLAVVIATIPIQDFGSVALRAGDVTATRLAVGALVLAWLIDVARGRTRVWLGSVAWAYAAVVGTLTLSFVHAVDIAAWAGEVYRWGVAALVYVIADQGLRQGAARRLIVATIGAGVLGSSLLGFVQFATDAGPASYRVDGLKRIYATFGAPNPFAAYLELGVPLLLAVAFAGLAGRIERDRLWWWSSLSALAGMGALLLTQSRGGALGFAAALVVLVVAAGRGTRLLQMLGVAVIVVALLSPAGAVLRERFASVTIGGEEAAQVTPDTWANQERAAHWGAGVRMMRVHPLTGVGAGQFNARYREFTPVWRFRVPRGHAHNGFIQMGAQAGVPGLVAMLVFTTTLLVRLLRAGAASGSSLDRSIRFGTLAVVVAFSVHSAVDYLHVLSFGIHLATVVALATGSTMEQARC